jgi:hypothetical protein
MQAVNDFEDFTKVTTALTNPSQDFLLVLSVRVDGSENHLSRYKMGYSSEVQPGGNRVLMNEEATGQAI